MATFQGTSGNDSFLPLDGATVDGDVYLLKDGGDDTAYGWYGDDTFLMGASLTAADSLDGAEGNADRIVLRGDYSGGLVLGATTILRVEQIKLGAGFDYAITTDDATVAAGETLTVNAKLLGASDDVTFDGSAETDGRFIFYMGAGDDTLTGGAKHNNFHLESGGDDTANGGGNIDKFYMGASFDASDSINGGNGHRDQAHLNGDYTGANALVLGPTTMLNVEELILSSGHSYDITLDDATSNWRGLTIYGGSLGAGDSLTVDTSAEDDNDSLGVIGGAGDDVVTSGSGGVFYVTGAGSDTSYGGAGNDSIEVDDNFDAADSFDGGSGGTDRLYLTAAYPSGLTITGAMLSNVEAILASGAADLDLTFEDDVVASGMVLGIDSAGILAGYSFTVDGSAETDGRFTMQGGAGDDTFIGGAQHDLMFAGGGTNLLKGNGGADQMNCGAGADTVVFTATSQSDSSHIDLIVDMNFDQDKIDTQLAAPGSVGSIGGSVNTASFDADMGTILTDFLATVVHVNGGDLINRHFLVIDANGNNSYNAGDYVIELSNAIGTIDAGDFI